ncbi:MAG: 16S rRNA processing protein RimM [Desulfobacterales bacterium]|nr:MAG: 16S rRNA processing protein RimM [Desulfobacterales bacterium]
MSGEWLTAGKITGVHGVRGEFRLRVYTESLAWFAPGRRIRINMDAAPDGPSAVSHKILSSRPHKGVLLVLLDEVTDRAAAEMLIGAEALIPAEDLPEIEEDDTWYWKDLIGMTVRDEEGGFLGSLTRIIETGGETGGNDVYVVTDNGREILIPALASVVRRVDVPGKQMTVRLPEGL